MGPFAVSSTHQISNPTVRTSITHIRHFDCERLTPSRSPITYSFNTHPLCIALHLIIFINFPSPVFPNSMYGKLSMGQSLISICLCKLFAFGSWVRARTLLSPCEKIFAGEMTLADTSAATTFDIRLLGSAFLALLPSFSFLAYDLLRGQSHFIVEVLKTYSCQTTTSMSDERLSPLR